MTGSGTRVTASGHAGPRDGQSNASAIGATANGHSESASALVGPGSGQDLNRDRQDRTRADESQLERCRPCNREWPVERECDPRDRERVQQHSSRESRPLEGNRQEEWEREQDLVDSPSRPTHERVGRLEDSTGPR